MAFNFNKGECPHPDFADEYVFGNETGDIICMGCGEVYAPGEPEYEQLKRDREKRVRENRKDS